jgi:AcrR family transcriptional regulator
MSQRAAARRASAAEEERVRLDRDRILDAAEAIAANEGVGKLTMRRLGAELGADPTALYRHFRNKDELLVELADRLFGRSLELDPALPWRERLRLQLRHGLNRYRAHPDLALLLAQQPDDTPALRRLMEDALSLLAEVGLPPEDQGLIYQVLENHVVGTGLYYAITEANPDLRTDRLPGLRRSLAMLPVEEFPHLTTAAPHLFPDMDEAFDLGTEIVADAIERLVRHRASTPPNHRGATT